MNADERGWGRRIVPWGPAIVVVALAAGFACVAVATLGGSLGTFLAGVAVVTVLAPFAPRAVWGVVAAVAVAWTVTVVRGEVRLADWAEAVIVLIAYGWAMAGSSLAIAGDPVYLARGHDPGLSAARRRDSGIAGGVVLGLGLFWLTWPFWMASFFRGSDSERVVAALVWGHPVFAINGVMEGPLGVPWAQHRLAYEQTNIGDDVPYAMPRTVWPAVVLHGGIGLACLGFRIILSRLRSPATPASPASAAGSG